MTHLLVEVPENMLEFVKELLDKLHLQVRQEYHELPPSELDELERREVAYHQNSGAMQSWEEMENALKTKYERHPLQ